MPEGFESESAERELRLDMKSQLDRDPSGGRSRPFKKDRRLAALVATAIVACFVIGVVETTIAADRNGQKAHTSYVTHAPIVITGNSEFKAANGVARGSGTVSNPYIIEGWDIASGGTYNECISITDTTAYVVIQNCHLYGSGATAVDLTGVHNADVRSNLIDSGMTGISVSLGVNIAVSTNTVTNMDAVGIQVQGSQQMNVSDNEATLVELDCILVVDSHDMIVSNNTASSSNNTGMMIDNGTNVLVFGNIVSYTNSVGLQLNNSQNVIVQGNNITLNLGYGMWVSNSANDLIYHNNFISNTMNAYQESSSNIRWNATYYAQDNITVIGGNYWDTKVGTDIFSGPGQDQPGADGIFDSRYLIAGGGSDYYPLLNKTTGPLQIIPEFQDILMPIIGLILVVAVLVQTNGLKKK
jgi:parallel beta-helix repeat protein